MSKSVMKRIAHQTKGIQETVFKFLWPDKCCDICHHSLTHELCASCGMHSRDCPMYINLKDNPDLSSPVSMGMMLDRLKELGHEGVIMFGDKGFGCQIVVLSKDKECMDVITVEGFDTAPLAVLNAVQALMEKEEER